METKDVRKHTAIKKRASVVSLLCAGAHVDENGGRNIEQKGFQSP